MIGTEMRRRAAAVLGLAFAGAQAGHLVAYEARFGAAAQSVQSSGAHSYFPALVKTSLGGAALALIAALLLIGVARVIAIGPGTRRPGGPSYLALLAAIFTIQLVLFTAQEVGESVVAGVPAYSAANLLLWGMLGQLPVALVAATVLRWLWSRVEAAARELGAIAYIEPAHAIAVPVIVLRISAADQALVLSHRSHAPFVKRGPPALSPVRTY
jgi:hypothetical protein